MELGPSSLLKSLKHKQLNRAGAVILRQKGFEIMDALFINGNRNGYGMEQCGRTLSVGELIEILSNYDEETPVYLRNDNGYTYGSITEWDINTPEDLGLEEEDYE